MKARHPLVLIAAVALNRVIGRAGSMPWWLPGDLAHFRESTLGRPLLIGRRTFQSIGRPLPGRLTIVVSRDPNFRPEGVAIAPSVASGLTLADAAADQLDAAEIIVGGGATLYEALIEEADALWITRVEATPDGDTLFPQIDERRWTIKERRGPVQRSDDSARYSFEQWVRLAGHNGCQL